MYKKPFRAVSNRLQKLIEMITYYVILADLYILELFTRQIPYFFFLFTIIYGTFGYQNQLSTKIWCFKAICFFFSWYLLATSLLIFAIFKVPTTQKYFYDLLGKEFVISKIGNSGGKAALMFWGTAATAVAGNEIGREADRAFNQSEALQTHKTICESVERNPHMTDQEHTAALNQANADLQARSNKTPTGYLDRVATNPFITKVA